MHASASFTERTAHFRQLIDSRLDVYSQLDSGCPEVLREAVRYSLLGSGKRLRPMLTLMAAEACGCLPNKALPVACAVEMVHAYSLIHDDLPAMDDDDLRRGRPTCHIRFGEGNAILAGDALLTLAFEVIAVHQKPETIVGPCCGLLARAAGASGMVGGQVDDLAAEEKDSGTLDELEHIHRRKTGAMLEVSLTLGGMVAGAGDKALEALRSFGENVGLAFQVVDDLLDFAGSEEQLGKRIGKDAGRGKLTYPGLLGVEPSRQRAAELVARSCQAAEHFGERGEMLTTLARYVLERKR